MDDETRDISNQEQLSICIRWIDSEFSIHEDLIGMVHFERTDATSISTAIKDVLVRCSLSISQCRGQGYDGCQRLSGFSIGEMFQLILYSPKRSLVFDKCQREFSPESPGLRPFCPTQCTVRTGALESILKNYETLIHAFREIYTTSHDDYGRRSGGVMTQLELFQT